MMRLATRSTWLRSAVCALLLMAIWSLADETLPVTIGIFSVERGDTVLPEVAEQCLDLLTVEFSSHPSVRLVERSRLQELIGELELTEQGHVSADHAVRAGRLLGAQVVLSGVIFDIGERRSVVVKLTSCETSQTIGWVERLPRDQLAELPAVITRVAEQLMRQLAVRRYDLVPSSISFAEQVARARQALPAEALPALWLELAQPSAKAQGKDLTEVARATLAEAGIPFADDAARAALVVRGELNVKPLDSANEQHSLWVTLRYQVGGSATAKGSETRVVSAASPEAAQAQAAEHLAQAAVLHALRALRESPSSPAGATDP